MNAPNQIFRQAALDRLSSPDELDLLTQVTTPKGWIALYTLFGSVVVALGWGIFGSLPTAVEGPGIITRSGGLVDITTSTQGRVRELRVDIGDEVKAGDVIAVIAQPELDREIQSLEERLADMSSREASLMRFGGRDKDLQASLKKTQKESLQNQIQMAESRLKSIQDRITTQQQLLDQGLITRQQLLSSRVERDNVIQEINSANSQLRQIDVRQLEEEKASDAELANVRLQKSDLERQIESRKQTLDRASVVVSPYSGRVIELKSGGVGSLVSVGSAILSLEPLGAKGQPGALSVTMFAPSGTGKSIKPGMEVQVSPGNVKREESGFMIGHVKWVADYPSSGQGIMRTLQNERLVEELSKGGAPIKVLVDLDPDKDSPTGFKWSSRKGPSDYIVASGTLCRLSVITERQPPIALVMPAIRKFLGLA
ncbi:MAG TPA: NHLP bacteriocin system secretion protein [Usitatibacter sp.]|nr:NHLP bacteriocin system secretion protein [Usitatibacter sp.]